MARNGMLEHGPCPFVNHGDGRCSCRMTKQTLAQAFDFCLGGGHYACQTFHAISWEHAANSDESKTQLQPGTATPLPLAPQPRPGNRPRTCPAANAGQPAEDRQAVA